MESVQKIECKNVFGSFIVMSFSVFDGQNATSYTEEYPVFQSQTIDLAESTFPVGATIWPVIKAMAGETKSAAEKFTFAMNGKTAVFEVKGTTFNVNITFDKIEDGHLSKGPQGFPSDIPINDVSFKNWDRTIEIPEIWTCAPRTASDVVDACNWAAQNGYTVRPRGIMHNWSPLSVAPNKSPNPKILLIDTTKSLNGMTMLPSSGSSGPRVKVGTGATMGNLLAFLERQAGGKGAAPGFSFPHVPAPDHLTIGGVIAINGHGSAVATPPNDDFATTYGSMSNRILELTAVVTDPAAADPKAYVLKSFQRGDPDTKAFLTQLGRALIVDVTLQVIDNYNLRCISYTNIDKNTLFKEQTGPTPPPKSCAEFLNQTGRIEVIWFPFTNNPWLKVWSVEANKPASSIKVNSPNNYPFSDNLPESVTNIVKTLTKIPGATVVLSEAEERLTNNALDGKGFFGKPGVYPVSRDIWGPSKNTLFYVKDTTLRVTANGYAILMKKADVQQGIADFAKKFEAMLTDYQAQGKYPINAPLEIRVTGLDSGDQIPTVNGRPADRPVISSLATDKETEDNGWEVALWLDVLTLPGTAHSDEFYVEMEAWFLDHFKTPKARVVPEWSKGWAYSDPGGAWTNKAFIDHFRTGFTTSRTSDDTWAWEEATLAKYDAQNLFRSPLIDKLFNIK